MLERFEAEYGLQDTRLTTQTLTYGDLENPHPPGMIARFPPHPVTATPIHIGPHRLQSPFALAPMAGLTDVPFRTLAWRYGAGYMVSEMVSSKPELWESGKSRLRRVPVPGVTPVAVQIAGSDPQSLAESARRHVDDGVDVIDINLGCPAKKVCRKAAGSALLNDLDLVARIVEATARAVSVPVTVKTRTGVEAGDGMAAEIARVVTDSGAQLLVMHARSRACRFVGAVDYAAVRSAVEATSIPVLVNGDIKSAAGVRHALAMSGAAGVMIGRGAFGRPWLFQELLENSCPSWQQKWTVIAEHLHAMHEFYGEPMGVRIARKHIEAYCNELSVDWQGFARLESAVEQQNWVRAAAQQNDEAQAA